MINEKIVVDIVEKKLEQILENAPDKRFFIAAVYVNQNNTISLFIDNERDSQKVTLDDCVVISKYIESQLDREKEDYDLEVSTAGLGSPLKVFKQYIKNINQKVEVITNNGKKLSGILIEATPQALPNGAEALAAITIEYCEKVKVEGKKQKIELVSMKRIESSEFKTVRVIPDLSGL